MRGRSAPPERRNLPVRLDEKTYERLRAAATAEDRSMSSLVRRIIEKHLDAVDTGNRIKRGR